MKLVTFRTDAHDRGGVLVGDAVIDLAHAFSWLEHREGRRCDAAHVQDRFGKGVLGFVENAREARPAADSLVEALENNELPAAFDGRTLVHPLRDVRLRAPLPRPPSMRDGYAFRQHVETARRNRGLEMIPEFDAFPVFYFTNHQGVTGPGEVHVRPLHCDRLDYELEAAVVVGKEGKNLTAAQADDAIFGMTIMNDWSARALQMEEMKLNL
ncbi:MAG TPA: fumarylacetoacetate hydrolase family protein, partial [Polyangiaceae bacterium]